jgi:hypothetical protein
MADLLLMIDSLVESENETTDLFLGHVAERSTVSFKPVY